MPHQNHLIPASYIFSYWIFAWAIAYIFVKYAYALSNTQLPKQIEQFNPSLVLLVALIWNAESLLSVVSSSSYTIVKYVLMIVCIKAIPLWILWTWDIHLYRDILFSLVLFAVYCVYLWLNKTNFVAVYEDITKSIENNEDRTPFEHWFQTMVNLVKPW